MKKETKKVTSKPASKGKSSNVLNVSPSAWMVWEKCALSLQSVKSPFQLERDEYAKEGTRLHQIIADVLKDPDYAIDADSDDAAMVRFAVETVKNESAPCTLNIEIPLFSIVDGVRFSGIADCIYCVGDTIVVIDFKTGWREVEAEGNSQLKQYAHIAANTPPVKNNNWKPLRWKGIIINARFNSVSYTGGEIEKDYLSNTAKDILARTKKKQFKTGNHCAYCGRLSTCAKLRKAITEWCRPGMLDGLTRDPEKLAEALRLAKPAEKLFETIKKEAQMFIDLGGVIPGVTVEYTAGTRTWPRDMSGNDIAERIGVKFEHMIDQVFKSPAQAEKFGADKELVNAIAIRPPRKGFKFV